MTVLASFESLLALHLNHSDAPKSVAPHSAAASSVASNSVAVSSAAPNAAKTNAQSTRHLAIFGLTLLSSALTCGIVVAVLAIVSVSSSLNNL